MGKYRAIYYRLGDGGNGIIIIIKGTYVEHYDLVVNEDEIAARKNRIVSG